LLYGIASDLNLVEKCFQSNIIDSKESEIGTKKAKYLKIMSRNRLRKSKFIKAYSSGMLQ